MVGIDFFSLEVFSLTKDISVLMKQYVLVSKNGIAYVIRQVNGKQQRNF